MVSCRHAQLARTARLINKSVRSPGFQYSTKSSENERTIQPLTLLHKTKELIPGVLFPTEGRKDPSVTLDFWNERLSEAYTDLTSSSGERQARVAVYANSPEIKFQARDIVTALLQEPFGEEAQVDTVKHRWETRAGQSRLIIQHDTTSPPVQGNDELVLLRSSYLSQFDTPMQIAELDHDSSSLLARSDVSIIVCNAFSLGSIPKLPKNNLSTIVAVVPLASSTLPSHTSPTRLSGTNSNARAISVDPARALEGLNALRSASSSANENLQLDRYQNNFSGSNISGITSELTKAISFPSKTFRTLAALAQIRGALDACIESLQFQQAETAVVRSKVETLASEISQIRATTPTLVLGTELDSTIQNASKELKLALDKFSFFRMVTQVDQISTVITDTMDRVWCKELELKLIMHAGTLAATQKTITDRAFSLPFDSSPLLHNHLQQLTNEANYQIVPTTLTQPIYTRRTQIAVDSSTRLHLAGRYAVLRMTGSVFTGLSMSWAGWVGWLAQTTGMKSGLIGASLAELFTTIDPSTLIGFGGIITVGGIRWAIGSWQKAKKRWWKDLKRVSEGLARDLRILLDETVEQKVSVVARTAVTGLNEKMDKRDAEAKDSQVQVEKLQEELLGIEKSLK